MITSAGSAGIADTSALSQTLAAAHSGDQLALSVTRGSQHLKVQVTLGELAAS